MDSGFHNYSFQMAFTVLTLSLSLLVRPSNLTSFIFLIGVPMTLGYTTYISRNEFNQASLASVIGLIFVPLGGLTALLAMVIFPLNVAVSFFASGDSMRDFYSSTALPLLLVGLLSGGIVSGYAVYNSSFEDQVQETVVEKGADRTVEMMEATGLDRNRTAQIKNSTYATVIITENFVVPEYVNNSDRPDVQSLRSAFIDAREEVPDAVVENSRQPSVRETIESTLSTTLSGRVPLIAFIILATGLYALQPLLGISSAFFARLFRVVDESISQS